MNCSNQLRSIIPAVLKSLQKSNIFQINLLTHGMRGYVIPVSNNQLSNTRYFCNNTLSSSNNTNSEQVYIGPLSRQIKSVKIISFATSICGILVQPMVWRELIQMEGSLPVFVGVFTIFGFFTFVTPVLLHFVAKRYVTQAEFNPETGKYTAYVLSFFCRKQKIEFSADDVKVPEISGIFTTFLVKGQPLFVDPKMFKNPTHYGKIMGYDKPMDFKLYENENTTGKN